LKIEHAENNSSIMLSWVGINGSLPIADYAIYSDGEFINNTTESSTIINVSGSSTFTVIPEDKNNNPGNGSSILFKIGGLIPRFTYNWNNTLRPSVFDPVSFDAGGSSVMNGTFERHITSYEWIFNDDINNIESGIRVNHTFTSAGINKISLKISDNYNNSEILTRMINITNNDTKIKGDLNDNNKIDIGDAAMVASMVVGKIPQNLAADFNNNSRVDIGDATKIAYYLVGKVQEL